MTEKGNELVETEVVDQEGGKAIQVITPMDLIQQAQEQGSSIEQMQQLFDLQIRYEENEAKKAYHKAVADFKAEGLVILKDKNVSFNQTNYNHATLGKALEKIIPALSRHGLSHSWSINQDQSIEVTCTLTHVLGHSTSVSMSAGKDDSGKKNAIQQVASTVSYLQRYTLFAITGLAAKDQDDDGINSYIPDIEYITESQACDIQYLMDELTQADRDSIFGYVSIKSKFIVDCTEKIPASAIDIVMNAIEKRSKK